VLEVDARPIEKRMADDAGNGEKTEREERRRSRRRARLIKHVIAGAILFFWFYVILGIYCFPLTQGRILESTVFMALVGGAAGGIISATHRGRFGGAVVGSGLFTVFILLVLLATRSWGDTGLPIILFISLVGGGLPGALIGFHVEIDS
jgi:hypothetical protein